MRVAIAGLLACACVGLCAGGVAASSLELDRAAFLAIGDASPPADAAEWEAIGLPDRWRTRIPAYGGVAWYRLALPPLREGGARLAVLLPDITMNAAVFVNDEQIGDGGSFEEPVARNRNRPLLFSFSPGLLDREQNHLYVRLFAYPHHFGGLGKVVVGTEETLRPAYERQIFWRIELTRIGTVLSFAMGALLLALWLGAGRRGEYGFLALGCFLWSLNACNYWLRDIPVAFFVWDRLVNVALDGFAIAMLLWAHRFLAIERPNVERLALAGFLLGATADSLVPVPWLVPTLNAFHLATLGWTTYIVAQFVPAKTLSGGERIVFVAIGAATCLITAHDIANQMGAFEDYRPLLIVHVVPAMLLVIGAAVARRFLQTLWAVESLNRSLEQRVAEKHAELEANYAELKQLDRERVLARERERLMREMHDGMGGQLVSTLALVESGDAPREEITRLLRDALDEMRLVIESLEPGTDDLPTLLGTLRARLDPVLTRSGIRFDWDVEDLPELPKLGSEGALHVLRIVQEAVTNAVRHSGARVIRVSTGKRSGPDGRSGAFVEVWDDGSGLGETHDSGRGIVNMRARTSRLGGALAVGPGSPGTRVALWIPA